ncbi:MAG: hypothetical protein KDC35_16460 [Acidobacteria bacterium]|nr:hypothetical protein [Acidobacteriota bacterium]
MSSDPYGRYYREVELHWCLKRQRQIIVSPIEFEAIDQWFKQGIPLAVVTRAIDGFVDRKSKTKRPYLLSHADGDVQRGFKSYQELHVGMDEGNSQSEITKKINQILRRLNQAARDYSACEADILSVADELKSIDVANMVTLEEIETALLTLDQHLIDRCEAGLDSESRGELEKELDELLTDSDDPSLKARMWRDVVRYHFELPRITALS